MDGVLRQDGRLPTVGEVLDPTAVGVHPALPGGHPAYVRRDRHDEIVAALRPGAFVLVTGPACAGTSRAAFEALAATLPHHVLVVPGDRTSIRRAVDIVAEHPRSILWLDLDRLLGPGGLTTSLLARAVGGRSGHRLVIGTMNSAPAPVGPPIWGEGSVQRRFPRTALTASGRARNIVLSRTFSPDELRRAHRLRSDPLLAAALDDEMAPELAAVLAGATGRLSAWRTAAAGANLRGAALVTAAVECRRAGLSAAPRDLLESLGRQYLQRSHPRTDNSAAGEWQWPIAWEWALGTGALQEDSGLFRVSRYLLEHAGGRAAVPDATLRAALDHADLADAARIAETAHQQGRLLLAERGYRRAHDRHVEDLGPEDPATLEVAHDRSVLRADRGMIDEAVSGLLEVHAVQCRVLGRAHPVTLATVQNLVAVGCGSGGSDAALSRAAAAVRAHEAALGPRHPATLACRLNLGVALTLLDRFGEAADLFRLVARLRAVQLGQDHASTLVARHLFASALAGLELWSEAEAERDIVLRTQRRLWGDGHPATLASRHERANLLRARGRIDEAIAELRGVLDVRTAVLGPTHPSTVDTRQSLAALRSERGDHDGLVEELSAVRALRAGLRGPDHPSTLETRHVLANLRWDLGDLVGAADELAAIVAVRTATLSAGARSTLSARHDLAVLDGERGELDRAVTRLTAVAQERARVLGPEHPMTVATCHDEAAARAAVDQRRLAETREAESIEQGERLSRAVDLYVRGEFEAAEPLLRDSLAHHERTHGPEHPRTLARAHEVAMVLHKRGLLVEAAAMHRAVLATRRTVLGDDDAATLDSQHDLGIVLWELQDVTGAAASFEAALAGRVRVLGADHPNTVVSRVNFDVVLAHLVSDADLGIGAVPVSSRRDEPVDGQSPHPRGEPESIPTVQQPARHHR